MAFTTLPAIAPCCCTGIFFFAVGGLVTMYGVKEYQLVQKIENTPTSKVRSAAVGLVELKGKARIKESIDSPISKKKCAYWHVNAQYLHHEKDRDEWITFHFDSSQKQFYIEDETGKMLIDPNGAGVHIKSDFQTHGHMSDKALFGLVSQTQLDKKVLDYLDANPAIRSKFLTHSGTSIRVNEYFIEDGDELYALGSAEPIVGAKSAIGNENLVLHKSKNEPTMLISDSPEMRVAGNKKWLAYISMGIGVMMLLVGVAGLLFSLASFVA